MTRKEVAPAHLINRYVYDLLLTNNAIGPRSDYGGKTPVVASQQIPEFNQLNKPYLVYGFSDDAAGDIPTMRSGVVSYAVYSVDDREIISIVNVLSNVFGRWDESARDVNDYLWKDLRNPNGSKKSVANTKLSSFEHIRFYHIETALAEGPGPAETEGGRQAGLVVVRFSYRIVHDDFNTVPTAT